MEINLGTYIEGIVESDKYFELRFIVLKERKLMQISPEVSFFPYYLGLGSTESKVEANRIYHLFRVIQI